MKKIAVFIFIGFLTISNFKGVCDFQSTLSPKSNYYIFTKEFEKVRTEWDKKLINALYAYGICNLDEITEFLMDSLHGIDHAYAVRDRALFWADEFELKIDRKVLETSSLLHDIKGLGSLGNEVRKNHHLEGAKAAKAVLEHLGWDVKQINLVVDCIEGHRGLPNDYDIKNYPSGFMAEASAKPQPVCMEARLIRDADTFQELDFERMLVMTESFRKNEANREKFHADYGYYPTIKFFDPLYVTEHFPDKDVAAEKKYEYIKFYTSVLLNRGLRKKAAHTDYFVFLLGCFLENGQVFLYDLKEVRDYMKNNAANFDLLLNMFYSQGIDFHLLVEILIELKKTHPHPQWQEMISLSLKRVDDYMKAKEFIFNPPKDFKVTQGNITLFYKDLSGKTDSGKFLNSKVILIAA